MAPASPQANPVNTQNTYIRREKPGKKNQKKKENSGEIEYREMENYLFA